MGKNLNDGSSLVMNALVWPDVERSCTKNAMDLDAYQCDPHYDP